MTNFPNPAHKFIPAYSRMNEDYTLNCLECSTSIDDCNCIWAAIRDLQSKTESNWDRIYKRDEAFGKRIIAIEEHIGKMIIDRREINSDYELHCNAILKLEDDVKKLNEAISMGNLEDKQTINTLEERFKVQRDWLNQRVNKIEEQLDPYCLSDHDERIHDLENIQAESRLIKLESENNMRQDTIACVDSAYDDACKEIETRLDKLDAFEVNGEYAISDLRDRVEKLEQAYDRDLERIGSRLNGLDLFRTKILSENVLLGLNKLPYKCPVCVGKQKHISIATNKAGDQAFCESICICCEGKGIVWG